MTNKEHEALVEQTARKIAAAHGRDPDECVHASGELLGTGNFGKPTFNYVCHRRVWEQFIPHAQAAIAAVREAISEPTPAALDSAVAFALNVQISGDYNWSKYMADVWAKMLAASPLGNGGNGNG